jgi:tetratricopeptide (TPR) repeat protein/NAD-dependent dihydropyrimidine dehydrogenase PreA subunit
MCSRLLQESMPALLSRFFLILIWLPGKVRFSGCHVTRRIFWRKFANSVKSGCVSQELKTVGAISGRAGAVVNTPGYGRTGIRKSKTSRWRAAALIALNVFMVAHVIQWRIMGKTISPIEPSETMYTLQKGFVNAGFIFFTLAILATLIFGRFVCGWGCHIVALQDFCGWLLKKMGLQPKPFRSRLLVYVPLIAALYMFVWPVVYRLFTQPHEPLIPNFTNHLVTTNFWLTFPSVAVAIPFLFVCGFVTVYFLGQKGFCTYACPYGGFFGLADKFSPGKIRVTPACNQCGHCTATCTSNVLVHAEVKQYGMVVDPGCMKCMDCVSVCPNDALYFGFGKPTLVVPKSNAIKRSYSLSWPEEIVGALVFLGSFLAVRGVYALVPFLMALGCAAVTTFLTLKLWQLFRARELSFYRFNLKSSGKVHKAGWTFAIFACAWIGLNAHSGWVRYHEFLGNLAFQKIQLPDELALAQVNPARWLSTDRRQNIINGKKHYEAASKLGLFVNSEALPKLAWFQFLLGDAEQSVQTLAKAAAYQKDESKALSLYYRGAILNRLGRYDEARVSLDQALAEREDLILARQEKGESLWHIGRREEAVSVWRDAVQRNARLALVNNELAGAARASGNLEEADRYEKQADQFTPNNSLYQWVLGRRLQDLGMTDLAEKHFQRADQLGAKNETSNGH